MSPLVLVVDDNSAVRALMARALAEAGYEVLAASSAEHALELVAQRGEPPQLAVIDVHLAGTDGPTLAKVLRRGNSRLPVLFISGYGDAEQRAQLADPLLAKPFDLETLAHRIWELLQNGGGEPESEGRANAS